MDLPRLRDRLRPARRLRAENESLQSTLRRTRAKLAKAQARATKLERQRDKARDREALLRETRRRDSGLGYVFIVTYGRSGSTLLQGILNSIPGYLIRGENGQVLRSLYEFDQKARAERRKRRRWLRRNDDHDGSLPVTHPFHGIDQYPYGPVIRQLRQLIVDNLFGPGPDTRVVGFKEIRWTDPDTPEFIAWLRRVFPGVKLIVNTRNLQDVSRSGWWGASEDSRERLEEIDAMLRRLAVDLGEDAYHLHYDDYVADPAALAGLFGWLGEEFDLDRVREVLAVRHSFELPVRSPKDQEES